MKTYNLTIFRQWRTLLGLFILPIAFIGLLVLGLQLGSVLIGLLLIILYLFVWYYFAVGYLVVSVDNDELQFDWKKKFLFNYRPIKSINLNEVQTIIIDKGQFLRKVKTTHTTIYFNTSKIKPKDNYKLITFLQSFARENNVKVINSWREWGDNGYLKLAYRITTAVLIFVFIAVAFVIWQKGFTSHLLFFLFLIIPILVYRNEMRKELNGEGKSKILND